MAAQLFHLDFDREKNPILWIRRPEQGGKRLGERRVRVDDIGLPVKERFPIGIARPFVNPGGAVVWLKLSCHPTIRSVDQARLLKKSRRGFIPFDECPMANGSMPMPLRERDPKDETKIIDQPCDGMLTPQGQPIRLPKHGDGCKHHRRIIAARGARHSEKMAKWTRLSKSEDPESLKILKGIADALNPDKSQPRGDGTGPTPTAEEIARMEAARAELDSGLEELKATKAEMETVLEQIKAERAALERDQKAPKRGGKK